MNGSFPQAAVPASARAHAPTDLPGQRDIAPRPGTGASHGSASGRDGGAASRHDPRARLTAPLAAPLLVPRDPGGAAATLSGVVRGAAHGAATAHRGAANGAARGTAGAIGAMHGAARGAARVAARGMAGAIGAIGAMHGAAHGAVSPAIAAPCFLASPGEQGAAGMRAGQTQATTARAMASPVARGAHAGARRTAPSRREPAPSLDAETVIYRLEEAGRTLLALPQTGYTTRLRTSTLDIVRSAIEGDEPLRSRDAAPLRPAVPGSDRIDRMDEALAWIPLIPRDRYVLRRIVGARSLVSPVTERHLFAWRRLGSLLGADHKAIQRWHAQGIDLIVAALRATPTAPCAQRRS